MSAQAGKKKKKKEEGERGGGEAMGQFVSGIFGKDFHKWGEKRRKEGGEKGGAFAVESHKVSGPAWEGRGEEGRKKGRRKDVN